MNSSTHSTWQVLPHRPIEHLAENLWRVDGDLPGMPLTRVMTVVRRSTGALVVHSPIALEAEAMTRIDQHGEVDTIVVPNAFHRLDAPAFKARYPKARVLCPPGARSKVAKVVPVDGIYEDLGDNEAVSLATLEGTAGQEGVMTVRSPDGITVVLNDILFNIPHGRGFVGFVFRYVTASSGGPRVTRIARLFLVKDAQKVRAHLRRLADTPDLVRVIVSHGAMGQGAEEARSMLEKAIATLI